MAVFRRQHPHPLERLSREGSALRIALDDTDAEIEPTPVHAGRHRPEPELDRLSNILEAFNEQFGKLSDEDRVVQRQVVSAGV